MNTIIRSLEMSLSIVVLVTAATAVLQIGITNVSQAQVSQKTQGQNPMCDPTDRFINTTESHVCGVPKTPLATPAQPTTTQPPSSITPSPPSGTEESPIPGLPWLQWPAKHWSIGNLGTVIDVVAAIVKKEPW